MRPVSLLLLSSGLPECWHILSVRIDYIFLELSVKHFFSISCLFVGVLFYTEKVSWSCSEELPDVGTTNSSQLVTFWCSSAKRDTGSWSLPNYPHKCCLDYSLCQTGHMSSYSHRLTKHRYQMENNSSTISQEYLQKKSNICTIRMTQIYLWKWENTCKCKH